MNASNPSFRWRTAALVLAAALPLATLPPAGAAEPTRWGTSWMASPQPLWDGDFLLPLGLPRQFQQQTLRQVARLSVGGDRVRVVFSNEEGRAPLFIGAAHVARPAQGASVLPGSVRELRFGGRREAWVPPGARLVSDAVDLPVAALAEVAVSLYLPRATAPAGFHFDARQTAYLAEGNLSAAADWPANAARLATRAFVSGLMVEGAQPPQAVITLGDSITDGNGATPGAHARWPDVLAQRLAPRGVAVLNAGISGARLLRDGMGRSGLQRLAGDVLAQPGVRTLVVLLGTNDIGWPGGPFAPHEPAVSVDELVQGYRLLIEQAHAANLRVVAGTLPPFEHALQGTPLEGHHSPQKDATREAVNRWIRESGAFDAVIDFDHVLRDPAHPSRLLARFDSGDHLHPGDAGYRAMAEAIDLETLLGPGPAAPRQSR